MLIGKLLLKILPLSYYYKARSVYHNFKKRVFKPLSETDLINLLTIELQIKKGDVVFVHSSIDKLNTSLTPFQILDLLIKTVGEDGTLLFPSWHSTKRAELFLNEGLLFDVKRSPSVLGLLSEIARRNPKAHRSLHPTNSIAAIGKNANELLFEHHTSIYPCGELSPFYKMISYDAKIIGLGIGAEYLSFVHCPEDVLKDNFPYNTRKSELFTAKVKSPEGQIIEVSTLVAHPDIAYRNISSFLKKYADKSIAREFNYRGNKFFYASSKKLYDLLVSKSQEGITIYGK